ncbi:MAG: hydantoinase/oxoprolinase N-terminal domain-containing protein [Sphingorhabdus sp.]
MRIGIDVGGTNTDAVLIDQNAILASVKRPTTDDVSQGIMDAIQSLLDQSSIGGSDVDGVMIGTTQFTNAFVQCRDLTKVFALRIGFPAARGIPPFSAWPDAMRDAIHGGIAMVGGGFEFDGREIGELDEKAVVAVAEQIKQNRIEQVAISCVFSQLNDEHEKRAAEIISEIVPGVSISLSSEVGRVGLLERENAAIMNGSLRPLASKVAAAYGDALRHLDINAPYYVSQNDGTLMQVEQMCRYPVLTFAAGPTNSLRGAAWLTGMDDAVVVDIGGTTTDIGVLVKRFPRQSSVHVDIGGVRTNFRMPDILAVGLGGGSKVRQEENSLTIGPDSVGYTLQKDALIFGGDVLTASDIAVASGQADFGDKKNLTDLDDRLVADTVAKIHAILEDRVDRMKTSNSDVPVILVGGGAILINQPLQGVSEIIRPEHADVANAIGAAFGQVSGEIDQIYNIEDGARERTLDEARSLATERAIKAGADANSVEIINIETVPLQYLTGGATRVVCRAVGDLARREMAA